MGVFDEVGGGLWAGFVLRWWFARGLGWQLTLYNKELEDL